MKIEDRLKLYELALADYEKSLGADEDLKRNLFTITGLCAYFWYAQEINLYNYGIKEVLPELHKQQPTGYLSKSFWYPEGDIQPRIDCLKKAIELTKKNMK